MSYSTVDSYEVSYPSGQLTSISNHVMRGSATSYACKIEQWHNGNCIRGVQVTWSDGTVQSAGSQSGDHYSANFTEPFLIYKVDLAACNYRTGRFDGMKFCTIKGASSYNFVWGNDGNSHETLDFPHGVQFLGFDISSGSDIDKLTLIVSPELTSYEYVDVNFDTSKQTQFNAPEQLETILAINGDSINQAAVLSSTRSVTVSQTVTDSHGGKVGISAKFGKKDVLEVTPSAEGNFGQATAKTETTTRTVTANLNLTVLPYSKVTANAVASIITTTVPFSGTLIAKYAGGSEKRTAVNGIFTNVDCASFVLTNNEHEPLTTEERALHSGISQHSI